MRLRSAGTPGLLCGALVACVAASAMGCEKRTTNRIDAGPVPLIDATVELPGPDQDTDGDAIPDLVEGWEARTDTDGDGQPDFEDTDSDADGIPDRVEAGDDDLTTAPIDSDGDGDPDYVDLDSDDNGLPDRLEGADDADGDGTPDHADDDDDDDRIPDRVEIGGGMFPRDSDLDGVPDFRDEDSDGDAIADRTEAQVDTDGDGTPDYLDLDSDADGYLDAEEAGDGDLSTEPVDTDMDLVPDYRDLDSDGDGLSDALEREEGTDPRLEDTDGDGVSDLIEVGAGTDARSAGDNPRARGDFVFVVPYREEAQPPRDTLLFRTNIRRADVYFLIDTTGSMAGEIDEMKARVVEILEGVACGGSRMACTGDLGCPTGERCSFDESVCLDDPESSGCVADLWTGVGVYAGADNTYRNLLSLQPDATLTRDSIPERADGLGSSESLFESIACVADPQVCFGALCGRDGVGCPAFRRDAVRTLVTLTDEPNQCNPDDCTRINSAGGAGGRLALQGINFVGVDADRSHRPRPDLQAVGRAAQSVNARGEPYYYEGQESAVSLAVTQAITEISRELRLFVEIDASDLDGDDGDSLQFISRLEATSGRFPCGDAETLDTDRDGFADAFPDLLTGTRVCWDVIVRPNNSVAPIDRPQVFVAALTVFGEGSPLDQRRVFFLVPPRLPEVCPDPPCN